MRVAFRIISVCGLLCAQATSAASQQAGFPTTPTKGPPYCVPDTGQLVKYLVGKFVQIASDPQYADSRIDLDTLPLTPAGDVTVVTNETLCKKASSIVDQKLQPRPSAVRVLLIQAGTRYYVIPIGYVQAGSYYLMVLGRKFQAGSLWRW